ncbi:MAG TPA: hypothetical protein VJC08_02110 [bacterium]|nr:hypothetical protein [bacterium]
MATIKGLLILLNDLGIWELLNFLVVLSGLVSAYLFFGRKGRIPQLNIHTHSSRQEGQYYSLLINIEFRNFTGCSIVIANPYFKYKGLRRHPSGHRDASSNETEVKFASNSNTVEMNEVDTFLRHRETKSTWIPVDPKHSDDEINHALKKKKVGKLYFHYVWIKEKPQVERACVNI